MDIMKYYSLVSAIIYAKRNNLKHRAIKYNSDILIDFEKICLHSLNYIYIPLQCGKSKLFYNEFVKYMSEEPTSIAYWQNNTEVATKEFI